ncbi:hypothetical protein H072_2691 [Dactylellina haptotyla CBS 200.50]|uniref:Rho GDP-dissociation inhibitor n=2 Tax=Dactylellina haptotyla TaxID=430498 RepID=S8AQI7_DACHA|nr:GDP dissociation inhibitor [Dactylellina haptotyla]EPS43316.1 hypothetical protein H072_2691 [Dactylellina haptotyla CBS 200.50]
MADHDEDLTATATEGYKVGEKKSLAEYQKLDANDESLNKWKASLGLGDGAAASSDPAKVTIKKLSLLVDGREPLEIDLTKPNALETLGTHPFIVKEGTEYQIEITFVVENQIITGLRYVQVVKRKGIKVDRSEEMMGSYGPNTATNPTYSKKLPLETAPSGMLLRGTYDAASAFIDDDKHNHLSFNWAIKIAKDWS